MTSPEDVRALLAGRGATVAVAESLTGGELSAALSRVPGSSATLRGGLVVYATDLKHTLAGVPLDLLGADGPVSARVAEALAAGARERLAATFGLAVTGVAGPGPHYGIAAGTVYAGVAGPNGARSRRYTLSGERAAIRAGAVAGALDLLAEAVGNLAG